MIERDRAPLPTRATLPGSATEGDPLARLVRPFWLLCWASLAYAALALVPTTLPVYGDRLPAAWWLGVVLQFSGSLLLATAAWWRRRDSATWWLAVMGAGLGIEMIYTVGAVALLTMALDLALYAMMAGFGAVSLGVLVQLERWGIRALQPSRRDATIPIS